MATRTISNAGGNWNTTGAWVEGVVPTSSDDVVATGTSGNLTVPAGTPGNCSSINLTNYVATLTINATLNIGSSVVGPSNILLKFPVGMTIILASGQVMALISTSATQQTVLIGPSISGGGQITINGTGQNLILGANLTTAGAISLSTGTLDTGNFNVSVTTFTMSGATTKVLTLGSSTLTCSSGFLNSSTAGCTINGGTSNIVVNSGNCWLRFSTSPATASLNKVTIGGDNISFRTAAGISIAELIVNNAGGATGTLFLAGSTTTIAKLTTNGSAGNLVKMVSSTGASAWTISASTGTISSDYLSLQDSTATGGASFYAGSHSTNVSGNTGWSFTDAPGGGSSPKTKKGCGPTVGATISHWVC